LFRVEPNGSLMCDHCGKTCHGATFRVHDEVTLERHAYAKPEITHVFANPIDPDAPPRVVHKQPVGAASMKQNAAEHARKLQAKGIDAATRGDFRGAALLFAAQVKFWAFAGGIDLEKANNWRATLQRGETPCNPTARTQTAGDDPCPGCGHTDHDVTVYTMHPTCAYDGDPVVCSCGHTGTWHDGGGVDWACIPDLEEAHVVDGPECDHCGSTSRITTRAAQRPGYAWFANEDDDAHCVDCLAEGVVNWDPDEGDAWVCWGYAPEPPQEDRQHLGDALGQIAEAAGLGAPDRVCHYYWHARPHAEACWGDAGIEIAVSRWPAGVVIERLDARIWSLKSYVSEYDCRMAGRVLAAVLAAEPPRGEEGEP